MTRQRQLTTAFVCAVLVWAGPARADAVVDWNAIASEAGRLAITPPPTVPPIPPRPSQVVFLDLAMVHAAVHDAVQAIEGRFEPYHVRIGGAHGSLPAAVAKAAHDVLVHLYPAQTDSLNGQYEAYLLANDIDADDPGVRVGRLAAAGIIRLRANDATFPPNPEPFVGQEKAGFWRPTPPGFLAMAIPWLGDVRPFTLRRPSQFVAKGPPTPREPPVCSRF